jgi:hypothetical protein
MPQVVWEIHSDLCVRRFLAFQERTRAGLAAARQRGRVGGRPKVLTAEKLEAATKLLANGTPSS